MADLSRREFAALAAAAPPRRARTLSGAAAITAEDVIDRIKKNIGVEWKPDSVDGVKAGDPSTIVTGIVTTSMATMAVLQQAVKAGANLIITAQPTFYSQGRHAEPARGPRGGEPGGGAAGSRFHRQERVHHQEQSRHLPPQRSLATAPSRSARAGLRGRARLGEVSVRRRSSALRHARAHARRSREPCEERACGREAASVLSAIREPWCSVSACCPARRPFRRR